MKLRSCQHQRKYCYSYFCFCFRRLRLHTNKQVNGGDFQITNLQNEIVEQVMAAGEVFVDLTSRKLNAVHKKKKGIFYTSF